MITWQVSFTMQLILRCGTNLVSVSAEPASAISSNRRVATIGSIYPTVVFSIWTNRRTCIARRRHKLCHSRLWWWIDWPSIKGFLPRDPRVLVRPCTLLAHCFHLRFLSPLIQPPARCFGIPCLLCCGCFFCFGLSPFT